MHPLILFSSLAMLAPVFAAPNTQYLPEPTIGSTVTPISVAPKPTSLPALDELRRRGVSPGLQVRKELEERQGTCPSNYFACGTINCCAFGTQCLPDGSCFSFDDYEAQMSSILASVTGSFDYSSIYASYMSEYSSIYASYLTATDIYGYPTLTAAGGFGAASSGTSSSSNSNTNTNTNNVNVGSNTDTGGSGSSSGGGTNVGMIVGIVVAVVVVIIAGLVAWFLIRRNKKNKAVAASAAVHQPLMQHPPQHPPTPAPMPPPQPPYTPNPYDAYAGKQDNMYGYHNQPAAPGTVEMPTDQKPISPPPQYGQQQYGQQQYGQNTFPDGTHYQPPALPAAGIVEAGGQPVQRSQPQYSQQPSLQYSHGSNTISPNSTGVASELSGQHIVSPQTTGGRIPPPASSGVVYEMDSSHYQR